jgi:pimeloyl-ACP methyl ester carboxylesterase
MLHDSLGCVDLWRELPEQLCVQTGRAVYAYDRLGFGKSSIRKKLPSSTFIEEESKIILPQLLDHFFISDCILFGHSVGGGMALVGASQLKNRCKAVITESAQAYLSQQTTLGILAAEKQFQKKSAFEKLKKYHGTKAQWILDAWIKLWLSPQMKKWSLLDYLPKIMCPVLILHGDRDEFGTEEFPQFIKKHLSTQVEMEIISDCGHIPHREHPEFFLKKVSDFLYSIKV